MIGNCQKLSMKRLDTKIELKEHKQNLNLNSQCLGQNFIDWKMSQHGPWKRDTKYSRILYWKWIQMFKIVCTNCLSLKCLTISLNFLKKVKEMNVHKKAKKGNNHNWKIAYWLSKLGILSKNQFWMKRLRKAISTTLRYTPRICAQMVHIYPSVTTGNCLLNWLENCFKSSK